MQHLLSSLKITINEKLYVKDPETSELGRNILKNSIELIHDIGFESFTFKKLGERIQSNESSIYRYFENKHKLLMYLSSWYWSWMEYRMVFATTNLSNPIEKLEKAIQLVTENVLDDETTPHINEQLLNQIIIEEFTKTIRTKNIEDENKAGFFLVYKRVINRLIAIISEINPAYKYPKSLASTVVESALHQQFLKQHLKTITDISEQDCPSLFFIELVKKTLS
ncbi:TetR/AcrR family transcriptional regulator [Flavobacterium branchiophilum]|uniref:TetR/AcrR family transcriptional regulator n=2 Tax=Flavobacterium branchiophilum TaxID=55197 RepID=A0A2H3KD13_9FLAO|nr:TetR/AcrR family transcriptional regulator [Flavobacterium branchiophilum]PDS24294.1 TetR/AcrR family transcriptional regulator [Flavobacterium branchiophilum]CCB68835.1 Probable transcriptional regulator, TetR family [Flavobacterium branchiophilum FL-15]